MTTRKKQKKSRAASRRPYVKPVLRSSEPFERLALACTGDSQWADKSPPAVCESQFS